MSTVTSLDCTLTQWLSGASETEPAWGVFVEPRDLVLLRELQSATAAPFVILSPERSLQASLSSYMPESWHWIDSSVGNAQCKTVWYSYIDCRLNGRFNPSDWPSHLNSLNHPVSTTVYQDTLDRLLSQSRTPVDPHPSPSSGYLLVESLDPCAVLSGALETFSRLSFVACRQPSNLIPEGVQSLANLIQDVSPSGCFSLRDEWMCFTGQSLRDLAKAFHLNRYYHSPLAPSAHSDYVTATSVASSALLHSALRHCIQADWISLERVASSLSSRSAEIHPRLFPFISALHSHAALRFSSLDCSHININDPFTYGSDHYLSAAFLLLPRLALLSSAEHSSLARDICHRFTQLLLTAATNECLFLSESDRSQLFLSCEGLPERLATQAQLKQLVVDGHLSAPIIFIVGMHRSGTSALAGLLHHAGLAMPSSDLIPANDGNPRGHWESREVYSLNNKLLSDSGASWQRPVHFPPGWIDSAACVEWRKQMLLFIQSSVPPGSPTVLKDPRFSLLGSAMSAWLGCTDFNAIFFMCLRHPAEVAHSLWMRDQISAIHSVRLWIAYSFSAQKLCSHRPHRIVLYDHLLDHTQLVLDDCMQAIDWQVAVPASLSSAVNFVEPGLRHCVAADLLPGFMAALENYPVEQALSLRIFAILSASSTISQDVAQQLEALSIEWETYCMYLEEPSFS